MKTPIVHSQEIENRPIVGVTARDKYGINIPFRYEEPHMFIKSLYDPLMDYVFTTEGLKIRFWSRENLKNVDVNYIADELFKKYYLNRNA